LKLNNLAFLYLATAKAARTTRRRQIPTKLKLFSPCHLLYWADIEQSWVIESSIIFNNKRDSIEDSFIKNDWTGN